MRTRNTDHPTLPRYCSNRKANLAASPLGGGNSFTLTLNSSTKIQHKSEGKRKEEETTNDCDLLQRPDSNQLSSTLSAGLPKVREQESLVRGWANRKERERERERKIEYCAYVLRVCCMCAYEREREGRELGLSVGRKKADQWASHSFRARSCSTLGRVPLMALWSAARAGPAHYGSHSHHRREGGGFDSPTLLTRAARRSTSPFTRLWASFERHSTVGSLTAWWVGFESSFGSNQSLMRSILFLP